ncbi:hypothetical protein B0H16DRAFT_1729447 [Mycena metata]|uniref:Uncharacterized protein n=1 Tax=Mycena metata TaxID=1033252 RepID=A0AAD7IBF0_9AGAR|nr:hypothetical protein B0H16DRAFT_1729447 [Mycena metata]
MPAHSWTTPAQATLLHSHLPEYIVRQAQHKVNKFWPVAYEAYFQQFPEHVALGIDKANATAAQWEALNEATKTRKDRIKSWFRYQHRKTGRAPAARRNAQSSLSSALFNAKAARRRAHRDTEIFQQRNREEINAVLTTRGHDELNEEHMAVDGEDLEEQEARTKAARGARLRLRNEVVKELYEEAPEEERQAIAEAIRQEKENLARGAGQSQSDSRADQRAEERQIAIDQSSEVMERVLKTLADKTGWFSFAIWGGPNPRHGRLSLKCAVYGNTPAGNDFVAQHANFDTGISLPFQEFLGRCFADDGSVRPSIVAEPNAEDDASADGLTPPTAAEASSAPKPVKKSTAKASGRKSKPKPKRMSKPRKLSAPSASATNTTPAPAAATPSAADTPVGNVPGNPPGPTAPTPPAADTSVDNPVGNNFDLSDDWLREDSAPMDMDDIFVPEPTSNLGSPAPTNLNLWPEGMTAPTSPQTAARAAAAERGGLVSNATYAPTINTDVIDPALMQGTTAPVPARPHPRPCFNGAGFARNRALGESPTSTAPGWRWGGATAPHLRPVNGPTENQAGSSQSRLPSLFDTYRDLAATSPIRAYREQEAYRREIAARPRADIFGLSARPQPPSPSPSFSVPTAFVFSGATPLVSAPAASSTPTSAFVFSGAAPSASAPPASSTPAPASPPFVDTTSSAAPTAPSPPVAAAPPVVYNSRPMANPMKAAKVAKAAVIGKTPATVMGAAVKKRGRKARDVLTDITNDIIVPTPTPVPSAATPSTGVSTRRSRGSEGNAPVASSGSDENVQVCVAGPSGMRADLRRQKEAEKRAKETEAEERRRAGRLHNPDGNHDLVCVPPLRRSGRDSRAPPRPDEGYAGTVVKSTRGELGGRQGPQGLQLVPRGRKWGECGNTYRKQGQGHGYEREAKHLGGHERTREKMSSNSDAANVPPGRARGGGGRGGEKRRQAARYGGPRGAKRAGDVYEAWVALCVPQTRCWERCGARAGVEGRGGKKRRQAARYGGPRGAKRAGDVYEAWVALCVPQTRCWERCGARAGVEGGGGEKRRQAARYGGPRGAKRAGDVYEAWVALCVPQTRCWERCGARAGVEGGAGEKRRQAARYGGPRGAKRAGDVYEAWWRFVCHRPGAGSAAGRARGWGAGAAKSGAVWRVTAAGTAEEGHYGHSQA